MCDADRVYRKTGPARVFTREADAVAALREGRIVAGDVMVLAGVGPLGTGMEETYQVTSALKMLPFGKHVALLTDARFSGVSTGACLGHIGPEALASGPTGKLRDGDTIAVVIDRVKMTGAVDFVGENGALLDPEPAAHLLGARPMQTDLAPHPELPSDTPSGRAYKISAAGRGAAVFTMSTRSPRGWLRGRTTLTALSQTSTQPS